MSFYNCQGNRHNMQAFAGVDDECGSTDVFKIWKDHVDEKKAKKYVKKFTDHYDVPLHFAPKNLEKDINEFYHGKYGIFTCHDAL